MKETVIIIITLFGVFCGIKLEARYFPEKASSVSEAAAKPSSSPGEAKQQ